MSASPSDDTRSIVLPDSVRRKIEAIQQRPLHDWSLAFLDAKRQCTDPLADDVISTVLGRGQGGYVNQLFRDLVRNDDPVPGNMPAEISDYFRQTTQLPEWFDPDLIALSQQVYKLHGHLMGLVLSCKSLPESYACAKGAMVLYQTGRLNEHHGAREAFTRRIVETAQFVVNVMSPDSFEPEGLAIRTVQKVRLIHATIRYYLRTNGWQTSLYDEPINQEDMAGTLMAFSVLVLDGLKKMRINLAPEEEEAFLHAWRVVGYLMGVDDDLLPANCTDGRRLGKAILDHQIEPSDHGRELTDALIKFKQEISLEGWVGKVPEWIHFMVGPDIAATIGVEADPEKLQDLQELMNTFDKVDSLVKSSPIVEDVAAMLARVALKLMIGFMGRNVDVNFYLPESLKKDWGVDPT